VTATRNSLAGLIDERRDLARLIESLQEQLDHAWADLAHIDAALRLLGKEPDSRAIRAKRRYQRSPYFGRNELLCSRVIIGRMRSRIAARKSASLESKPLRQPRSGRFLQCRSVRRRCAGSLGQAATSKAKLRVSAVAAGVNGGWSNCQDRDAIGA
jgi:hypothetical protein